MITKPPRVARVALVAVVFAALVALSACSSGVTPSGAASQESEQETHVLEESAATKAEVPVGLPSVAAGPEESTPAILPDESDEQHESDPTAEPEGSVSGIDAANVIAAALVIAAGGDIEQAILEGQFTIAEVDAAVEAIESGTLGDYVG